MKKLKRNEDEIRSYEGSDLYTNKRKIDSFTSKSSHSDEDNRNIFVPVCPRPVPVLGHVLSWDSPRTYIIYLD